jgi:hypothetical protein
MKKLFLPLFLSLCLFGNSQKLIIDDSVTLHKGIYKTFDEFKFNCPSIPFNDYKVEPKTLCKETIFADSLIAYEIILSKEEKKKIKKTGAFGFFDGSNIYVRETSYAPYSHYFKKLYNLGLYSYFEGIKKNISVQNNFNYTTAPSNTIIGKAIDINNGEIIELTKSSLKSILENDEELLNRFKEEEDKKDKIREYIIEYSKRHKDDGIYCRDFTLNEETANLVLLRNESDTSDNAYYERVYRKLKINPAFSEVALKQEFYTNGNPRTMGIIAKHHLKNYEPALCRVGIWMSYYENGMPKGEIIYNITGSKLSSKKFDSTVN